MATDIIIHDKKDKRWSSCNWKNKLPKQDCDCWI